MILDQFPAAGTLPPESQLELAAELIELATESSAGCGDPDIVAALNLRLQEYRSNPERVSTFQEIRDRILQQAS